MHCVVERKHPSMCWVYMAICSWWISAASSSAAASSPSSTSWVARLNLLYHDNLPAPNKPEGSTSFDIKRPIVIDSPTTNMLKTNPMPERTSSLSMASTPRTPIPPGTSNRMPDRTMTSGRSPVTFEYAVPASRSDKFVTRFTLLHYCGNSRMYL